MKKTFLISFLLTLLLTVSAWAQAPVATAEEAVTALLNRIGGNGAADKFEIVIDANLAENGKDVFVITSQNGKPCIKGNTQLSVTTGINWYLNHHAHINLTWNNLTTDLSQVTLPVPAGEEKHVSSAKYRYDFNTCTFSYSMAFWTWDRWQKEIDWMALHGVNAPLNLVGLEVVTRNFLEELGVSETDIDNYIAGPGFMAWFAMNNLEGWGGTINSSSTGVQMNGNPDWWYTRQEQLCRNMLQRMRELGMQPVIPGFSGQIPNSLSNYSISGFSSSDVINGGTWAGGYTRPDILKPFTDSYKNLASVYYKHLEDVMGVSEFYSMDPFHEGTSLPSGITADNTWPKIMAELDNYYVNVSKENLTKYSAPEKPKWIIQKWQSLPPGGVFSTMSGYPEYKERFIGLDLFADNIYAGNAAFWQGQFYAGCPYVYCMLHNFGGRSGMHGRLETTMDGYFQALAKGNNCQGIGATPEGIETNPILYDMLFELPWMDHAKRPTADEWLADYAHARYGVDNKTAPKALSALKYLKKSVWDCKVNQQGTSEAVILARPNWTVGSVSTWSTSAIYWDTQDVLQAADELSAIKDVVTANGGQDGIANYNYDFIDVVRQAMVDYAAELLPLIKAAHDKGDNTEYTRLYQLYLKLMLDLDTMLSYDENFKLERWTSLARNIADEVGGTDENDRNWLEWNARTQVTVWSKGNTDLHDYSNRCWAGLIKDFHYKRWKHFFENNGNAPSGGWYSGFEYPWTVDFNNTYNLAGDYSQVVIPTDVTATEKAAETFGKYFGRVKGATKNYIFPMGVARKATASDVIPEVYRGQMVDLPLEIGKSVTISSVWVDLNNDGAKGNGETLTANNNQVDIPADAAIGKTTAQVVYSDGTDITFSLALIEDITDARTVTAVAGANGSVAIEGADGLTVTNKDAVKMTATANTGYNFYNWTKDSEVVSNDNPFIYYGKEEATFTANFIQDKWGVPTEDKSDWGDAQVKTSFVNELTFSYYNREPETIYEASAAPDNLFNTIPQIINVPQGASFDVTWSDNGDNGLQFCCLSAYIDLNADGDFTDEGELLKVAGTKGVKDLSVCEGKINAILPYDAPLGITHMRIRFDGAWKDNGYNATTKSYDAKAQLNRMCYEVVINVTEKSDKAATVNVVTNNTDWGTVEVWTDETPDGSTGTEWVVSANIPMYLRATKTSEDVEFLGWYDHYGRLLTENLEHTMYAREDATYTAKFRKFLEIDGWNIEYRTQPGSEIVTNKLAKGEKPVNGKKYYIAADAKQSNGSFVSYYLYDNGSALKTATSVNGSNYLWTCIVNEDGTYSFLNESGKYLANDGNYYLSIGATPAKYAFETANAGTGVALTNVSDGYTGSKWMVTKFDGSAFNKNSVSVNNGSWCNDYIFTEVSTPDVVVFTNVRKSGNHDLVIPETVDILGEQCKIVGFDNGVFNNNKDLWSITLPKSIEFLSEKSLLSGTMTGKVENETGRQDNADYTIYNLEEAITVNDGFKVTVNGTSDGSTFNQWGSGLFATGTNPLAATFNDGFQFYLAKAGNFVLKVDNGDKEYALDNSNCKVIAGTPFTATIEYKNNNITITVDNGAGQTGVYTRDNVTLANISAFSAAIPKGITLTLNVETNKETNPFSGCSNLDKIAFDGDCANYYVNGEGDLYNSSDVLVCSPEGKAKGADRRELAVLIDKMKSLTAQVATYNPVGKATEIDMQSTAPAEPYYIWCSNPHTGDNADARGGVAALLDEDPKTYLHTNWSSVSSTYDYLQIDNVNPEDLMNFKIAGQQRADGQSDRPKMIEIFGSNDNTNWTSIATVTGLPNTASGTWTSEALTSGANYAHYKFVVKTYTNENRNDRPYFHMAKFDLFKLTSSANLHKHFVGTELTAEFAAEKYDVLLEAIYAFDHATTAEEVQNALNALKTAYTDLEKKIKDVTSVKFTLDENNPVLHKIIIKRTEDGSKVLQYDEISKMVAVAEKANNSSWQAWYFIGDANGVAIHPYNADGRVLGATDTGNGAGKVSAVDEATYDRWTFLKQGDNGYFNLRAARNGAYFSNYGGTGNKMGFWNGDGYESKTQTDGDSLFKIEEVTFSNDNPRFYQLSDFKATTTVDGTNIYGGTSVGLYTGGKEYREVYTTAMSLINAGNTSESDACYETYKNLRTAKEGFSYNEPDENKFYVIKSVSNETYCKDKLVRTSYEPAEHDGSGDIKYDHRHLVFDAADAIPQQSLAVFQFEKTGTTGEYRMKNLHTGLYVKSFGKNADHLGSANEAQVVKIAGIADGQVTLKIGDADPMHAQDDYDCIVSWGAAVGNASTWTIEEANVEDICHKVTISSVGYSTLYLNYPVSIPTGVTVYEVETIQNNMLMMQKVENTIPARTGVVLKGNEGQYDFALAETTNSNRLTAILSGTLYKQTMDKEIGSKYYVLSYADTTDDDVSNPEVGFYQAVLGGDNSKFSNAANKAYLQVSETNGEVRDAFLAFSFEDDGVETDIAETEDGYTEGEKPVIFDLQGRRVLKPGKPGIYIVNGKKTVIK